MSLSSRRAAGFTLVELLVVLAMLGMLLWIFGQLFFPMQRLATRERLNVEARQTARAALDYLHYMLRGAGDMNSGSSTNRTPALLVTWACSGAGAAYQTTYDNVTDATLADVGTDIITISHSIGNAPILAQSFAGSDQTATPSSFFFNDYCTPTGGGSDTNLAMFKQVTGAHYVGSVLQSEILTVMNPFNGFWSFYRITSYEDGTNADCCSATKRWISVVANVATADRVLPRWWDPAASALSCAFPPLSNPQLVPGVRFYSLRVRNGWLEQKTGVFNPNTDNPGTDFVQILPNVEDLQFAYLFRSNQIRNNSSTNRLTTTGYVPEVGGTAGFNNLDVWGIRFTVTVRSTAAIPGGLTPGNIQPGAEDHDPKADSPPKVADNFYHVQLSGTALLRNRAFGF